MRSDAGVVIVGGGQAGAWAAATLRDEGFDGRVVLVGEEAHIPYERPPLSKAVLSGAQGAESCAVKPADFYGERNIELRLGCRAGALDRERRRLELTDGESLRYEQLVLATGARPRRLALPGSELAGIHYLRTLDDSLALRARLRPDTRVVLIGGGYIGLEVAATAATLGCQVTVVEALPEILARTMPAALSRVIAERHREKGVVIETGLKTEGFEDGGGFVLVRFADGRSVEADVVVVGIGIVPNAEIAEAAGIACDDGILVDEYGCTSDPAVFAAGDATRHHNPLLGRLVRLESWQNAQNQAIATARNLLAKAAPYAEIPWFWSDQFDMNIQAVGLAETWDQVAFRGAVEGGRFTVFCLSEGVLVAAYAVNAARDIRFARQMIADQRRPAPERLSDPDFPLKRLAQGD